MKDDLSEKDKNLLKTELAAMSILNHENIVNIKEIGNGIYYKLKSGK